MGFYFTMSINHRCQKIELCFYFGYRVHTRRQLKDQIPMMGTHEYPRGLRGIVIDDTALLCRALVGSNPASCTQF